MLLTQPDHFARWEAASEEDRADAFGRFAAFEEELGRRGASVVAGEGLQAPGTARTLQPGAADARAVTDGPFAESVEQIGGFFVVEAGDIDAVVESARVMPEAWTVEVRPATPRTASA